MSSPPDIAARAACATTVRHVRVFFPPASTTTILPVRGFRNADFEPPGDGSPNATKLSISTAAIASQSCQCLEARSVCDLDGLVNRHAESIHLLKCDVSCALCKRYLQTDKIRLERFALDDPPR